jgi:hypothetical protein
MRPPGLAGDPLAGRQASEVYNGIEAKPKRISMQTAQGADVDRESAIRVSKVAEASTLTAS